MASSSKPNLCRSGVSLKLPLYLCADFIGVDFSKALIAKILDQRFLDIFRIFDMISKHWKLQGSVFIWAMKPYYIFEFSSAADLAYFRQRQTVNIEGSLFVFRSVSPSTVPDNLLFQVVPIWIRVHYLPLQLLNTSVAAFLLSHVGDICEEESYPSLLPPRNFVRVKVWVDLSKPLIPGCYLALNDREHQWIGFSYEGVFRFCRTCGLLGHRVSFCPSGKVHGSRGIQARLNELTARGLQVLHGPPGSSFYSPEIFGLPPRLHYLNSDVNTLSSSDPVIVDSGGGSPVFSFSSSTSDDDNGMDFTYDESREVLLESFPLIRGSVVPGPFTPGCSPFNVSGLTRGGISSVEVGGQSHGGAPSCAREVSPSFRMSVPEEKVDATLELGLAEPSTPPRLVDVSCLFRPPASSSSTHHHALDSLGRTVKFVFKRKVGVGFNFYSRTRFKRSHKTSFMDLAVDTVYEPTPQELLLGTLSSEPFLYRQPDLLSSSSAYVSRFKRPFSPFQFYVPDGPLSKKPRLEQGGPFNFMDGPFLTLVPFSLSRDDAVVPVLGLAWFTLFPSASILHLPILVSDHAPIILSLCPDSKPRKRPYRIDNWCLSYPEVRELVLQVWETPFFGSAMFVVSRKLATARRAILQWVINHRISHGINWSEIEADLDLTATHIVDENSASDFLHLRSSRLQLLRNQRQYWVQRSKVKSEILDGLGSIECSLLQEPFRETDVMNALRGMDASKSPGPDGIKPLFFHTFWPQIGHLVTSAILRFLNSGVMPKEWNNTIIVLIPKTDKPACVSQFRPISLCNVIYRLASKCMANRLRLVIPSIISESRQAFVPDRLMSDGCLIAHEIMHYINKTKQGPNCYSVIKLDMHKAFDRVSWNFLMSALDHFGFPISWRNLIWECISIVTYSIMINGEPSTSFHPSCGLRQGDPLSPYLFIMCMEIISRQLQAAESRHQIFGLKISRYALPLSHLFYADDAFICCKATPASFEAI
ncbi:uncharacterized protein LOC141588296 [Silene latifolia]|uniref:uncharacterized protein LOC141588296 n=1 Tax=Silene latifolia TaxID=37657 RepID=UPI003D77B01C